jgi:hypothetical protein
MRWKAKTPQARKIRICSAPASGVLSFPGCPGVVLVVSLLDEFPERRFFVAQALARLEGRLDQTHKLQFHASSNPMGLHGCFNAFGAGFPGVSQ